MSFLPYICIYFICFIYQVTAVLPVQVVFRVSRFSVLSSICAVSVCWVKMASTEVEQKPELKLLGVTPDEQLRFMTHVGNVCRKVLSLVGVMSRLPKLIPTPAKLQIVTSAILPLLPSHLLPTDMALLSHVVRTCFRVVRERYSLRPKKAKKRKLGRQ